MISKQFMYEKDKSPGNKKEICHQYIFSQLTIESTQNYFKYLTVVGWELRSNHQNSNFFIRNPEIHAYTKSLAVWRNIKFVVVIEI